MTENFTLIHSANNVWYGVFPLLHTLHIVHGISSRIGGVSDYPKNSLNLALHVGDASKNVAINRKLFCEAVKINCNEIVTAEQIHSDNIVVVTTEHKGRGATEYSDAIGAADALITNVPQLPLMLFFADCVPILIADPVHRVVGLSHAGWKGTVAKIAQKTILKMQSTFNTNPADCVVGIGPSIGPCCYEIDEYVLKKVKASFSYWDQLITSCKEDRWKFNLWKTNRLQLEEIGVKSINISDSNVCTSCNNKIFFSHRAENGITGRMGAVIFIIDN